MEEGSVLNVLISEPCSEKGKGPLKPLKVSYHKEKIEDVANNNIVISLREH